MEHPHVENGAEHHHEDLQNEKIDSSVKTENWNYFSIRCVYLIGLIIWLLLIYTLRLVRLSSGLATLALLIPLIVFGMVCINITSVSVEVEEQIFRTNYFSVGLLLSMPLLNWATRGFNGDKSHFTIIILTAMVLILLTLVDFWTSKSWLGVYRHAKAVLQTMAVSLLIFSLLTYINQTSLSCLI